MALLVAMAINSSAYNGEVAKILAPGGKQELHDIAQNITDQVCDYGKDRGIIGMEN